MSADTTAAPDNTAVRVALWRALHLEVDAPPHVIEDRIGLAIAAPDANWCQRPDMNPRFTAPFRASIVARARFIEDLVEEQAARGVAQYVILGAGLDTFAQRRPELGARLKLFEIDQPGPQAWKRQRFAALGIATPDWLRFVPFDFEKGGFKAGASSWLDALARAGFDAKRPAVIASTGVSLYLTKEANAATLRQIAGLAPGSTLAMTFILPVELADPEVRPGLEASAKGAAAAGTPFLSAFAPDEMLAFARQAGFKDAMIVGPGALIPRYFANRSDGLHLTNGEQLLIATT